MQDEDFQISRDKQGLVKVAAIFFIVIGLCIVLMTWYQTGEGWGKPVNTNDLSGLWRFRSNIGGFVGGVVGPLFSLAGFFILYLTLQQQKDTFLKERFESKFFELLKLHRDNVQEFNIGNRVAGRKCFVGMLNEFHYIYKLTKTGASIENKEDKHYLFFDKPDRNEATVDFAFKIFFFGIGFNSEKQLKHFLGEKEFIFYSDFIKPKLSDIQIKYFEFKRPDQQSYFQYSVKMDGTLGEFSFETNYYPFDGHSIRLGHYFRLLFQCVKYVDKQNDLLTEKEKYFYLKTLRAQLSNQEQLLLYYDSLSEFGREWHKKGYFKTYSFLKNLPLALVEVKPHPHDKIGKFNNQGKLLFEWDRIRNY